MRALNIAIAGAGPAGLATALYLKRSGHQVTVFDQFDRPEPVGSGLMIQPTGEAVLRDLGVWDTISALGQKLERLEGRDARSGRLVLDVSYKYLGKASNGAGRAGLGVHRGALFGVLFDAVKSAGIAVETGKAITGLKCVKSVSFLQCAIGGDIGPFDLVVDGSGARSPLRPHSVSAGRVRQLAYGAMWATLDWREGFDPAALTQRYDAASVMIGVLPVGRQSLAQASKAAFFWSMRHAAHPALVRGGLGAWKHQVRTYWPDTEVLLEQIEDFGQLTLAHYRHATMGAPYGDGIAFVGDSAHATSPQLGQGANMALLDAKALSLALDDASSLAQALRGYAAIRRWHVRLYQALSWSLTPFYQSDSKALAMVRDLVVSAPARLPPAQWLLAQMVAGTLGDPLRRLGLG